MFRSNEVAYLKPSSLSKRSCIFGMGKGFLLILLFSSLKSDMKRTVPFFLGIIKVGAAHSERLTHLRTPIFTSLSTSFLKVPSCTLGIGKGLA